MVISTNLRLANSSLACPTAFYADQPGKKQGHQNSLISEVNDPPYAIGMQDENSNGENK